MNVITSVSETVESLKICSSSALKYPFKDWKIKPNGELCRMCESCRIRERDQWSKQSMDPEFRERVNAHTTG